MGAGLQIQVVSGSEAQARLLELARLRITVFRDYPYLYDGSLDYERHYLATYFRSPQARVVLCLDHDELVGASTAVPLSAEDETLRGPCAEAGLDPRQVMYFGESVLLPAYRGRGVGKQFFSARLAHAAASAMKWAAFCAVVRPPQHPLKPQHYRPLDDLWQGFGFKPWPGLTCSMSWKQVDEAEESAKTLQFWVREL